MRRFLSIFSLALLAALSAPKRCSGHHRQAGHSGPGRFHLGRSRRRDGRRVAGNHRRAGSSPGLSRGRRRRGIRRPAQDAHRPAPCGGPDHRRPFGNRRRLPALQCADVLRFLRGALFRLGSPHPDPEPTPRRQRLCFSRLGPCGLDPSLLKRTHQHDGRPQEGEILRFRGR